VNNNKNSCYFRYNTGHILNCVIFIQNHSHSYHWVLSRFAKEFWWSQRNVVKWLYWTIFSPTSTSRIWLCFRSLLECWPVSEYWWAATIDNSSNVFTEYLLFGERHETCAKEKLVVKPPHDTNTLTLNNITYTWNNVSFLVFHFCYAQKNTVIQQL
jgi:hypothetical protein